MALIIAADLTALGDAARSLGTAVTPDGDRGARPSLGHVDCDAAISDFHSTMSRHRAAISEHAAAGATALQGYLVAFAKAGD